MINIEKESAILQRIAANYPETSEEHEAIKIAASALHFVWHAEVRQAFDDYLKNLGRELTEEEKRHLEKMGVVIE